MKTIDLFGNEVEIKENVDAHGAERTKSGAYVNNPLHITYGKLEGEKCKNCAHLVRKSFSKVYYKCELRNNVDKCSPKSDHKVNWTACGKFKKETEQ
jgi:hypothetical protein